MDRGAGCEFLADPKCRGEGDSLRWRAGGVSAARQSKPAGFSAGGRAATVAGGAEPGGVSGSAGAGGAGGGRGGGGGGGVFRRGWGGGRRECGGMAIVWCGVLW